MSKSSNITNTNNQFFDKLHRSALDSSRPIVDVVAKDIKNNLVERVAISTDTTDSITEDASAVVYNPASFDSVYAACQLIAGSGMAVEECIPHDYLESASALLGKKHLLVCGVELSKETMTALLAQETGKVTLFAYRDSYSWMTERIAKRWGDRLEIITPDEEFVSELLMLTDNTVSWMTFSWLFTQEKVVTVPMLEMSRITAVRMYGLAFPVVPDLSPVGETVPREEEIRYKAILFNLLPQMRSALRSREPLRKLKEITIDANADAYMDHWRVLGQTYQRGAAKQFYRSGSRVFSVTTIACTNIMHYDLMALVSVQNDSFASYEDVQGVRIWRFFARDRSVRTALLASVKGRDTWTEGNFVCTYVNMGQLTS